LGSLKVATATVRLVPSTNSKVPSPLPLGEDCRCGASEPPLPEPPEPPPEPSEPPEPDGGGIIGPAVPPPEPPIPAGPSGARRRRVAWPRRSGSAAGLASRHEKPRRRPRARTGRHRRRHDCWTGRTTAAGLASRSAGARRRLRALGSQWVHRRLARGGWEEVVQRHIAAPPSGGGKAEDRALGPGLGWWSGLQTRSH